jgi:flagellar biosynthesis/type III secretory pathway chaperone
LAVLDSLKRELARERAALASARAEGKQYDQVAEAALTMLQQLLEEAKLRTEQALLKRDAELYESGRAQHAAARALGASLSQIEERTLAQLQGLDARCEARGQQVATLQARVVRATQAARSQRLEAWARQLARPLGDLGQP